MWVCSRAVRNLLVSTRAGETPAANRVARALSGEDRFMKRLILVVVGLCALAVAVPVAQTAPTQPNGCSVEHISGAECQGPDFAPAADSCEISTWVVNASCDLTPSDGTANITSGFVQVYAALQGTDWHTQFDLELRNKATGEVLYSRDGSNTTPVSGGPQPTNKCWALGTRSRCRAPARWSAWSPGPTHPPARHSRARLHLTASASSTTSCAARCTDLRRTRQEPDTDGLGPNRAEAVCVLGAAQGRSRSRRLWSL